MRPLRQRRSMASVMSMSEDEDSGPPHPTTYTAQQQQEHQQRLLDPANFRRTNLDLINQCDNFPYYERDPLYYQDLTEEYFALLIPGHNSIFGYMLPDVARLLNGVPGWHYSEKDRSLTLTTGDSRSERSDLIKKTCIAMRDTEAFEVLRGWRNELYPVYDEDGRVLFEIERSASCLFGVVTYGCHMTAYVKCTGLDGRDTIRIWVPRRAQNKQTYGGMLDNTVAGGIAAGESAFESLVRECEEEASLPSRLVRSKAKAAGVVTYFHIRDQRAGGEVGLLQPECQYVYDLELPDEVIPKPGDNEVESFRLMSVSEVKQALEEGQFKPNCALVLLDFFIRHGIITQQNERDFLEINARLHRLLEFPIARG